MAVKPIPEGYHSVTPCLTINGAAAAIDFYKTAFGAKEIMRFPAPGGKIAHAELRIGDSRIMLADECPEMNARSPKSLGGTPSSLYVYVPEVDTVTSRAIAAGAKVIRPLQDQFYGDRSATLEDPFGHIWMVATHVEDVPPAELQKRMEAAMKKQSGA